MVLRELLDRARSMAERHAPAVPPSVSLEAYRAEEDALAPLKRDVATLVGELMHFWGFGRSQGRIWAWLYLTPQPMNGSELVDALGVSAGTISTSLKELRYWGVIVPTDVPNRSGRYYTAATNLLPCILKVFREREMELIRRAVDSLEDGVEQAEKAARHPDGEAIGRFVAHRLRRLLQLSRLAGGVLEALIALRLPKPDSLRSSFRLD